MVHPELKIDEEFRDLIPPMSDEEYRGLENDVLANGVRDDLVVWKGHNVLVDGHNRLSICRKHDIPFDVLEMSFDSRDDVKIWIITNQLECRRNLSDYNRGRMKLKLKKLRAAKGKAKMSMGGGDRTSASYRSGEKAGFSNLKNPLLISPEESERQATKQNPYQADIPIEVIHIPNNQPRDRVETFKELAKEADVSVGSLHKIEKVEEHAIDGIKKLAQKDDISISAAYDASKMKPKRQQEIVDRIEAGEPAKAVMREARIQEREELDLEEAEESVSKAILYHESGVGKVIACDALITEAPAANDPGAFVEEWLYSALLGVRHDGFAYVIIDSSLDSLLAYVNFETPPNIELSQVLTWSFKHLLGNENKRLYKKDSKFILLYRGIDAGDINFSSLQERSSSIHIDADGGSLGTVVYELRLPIELAERLVRHSTKESFTVFDPFAKRGTVLLAAKKLGRDAIGYEEDEKLFEEAISRGIERA